ncbi:type II toxin-antitoxin system RelE/ParE family toxin [Geminocystis sp. GBBB08]|uniref:type II toxin-antitoxin system RelE/ParE family toxin n=1 Tax=Geminocystis sp. GBBB08 TaxID=2604140 RepID=UPI0027E30E66|nr:type II toxin-antitoxin system RelE/ParE family toxin [Geminocystis sp. GBBB08]MBL1208244.1 type II toxin-antitoxin system RelE/ParE family toxin [Geminocystis sp. GBBB08]
MGEIKKRPQVISDLIAIATYIGENNLEASDSFLLAAEETFRELGNFPQMGRLCQFSHPKLADIRQIGIKGFRKYLIFYCLIENGIEILRVIHGIRDIEVILEDYLDVN